MSYRIGLGFDPQDEGFAVVVPWRWALGDRPFVDEMNLMQTAGFLTYPFVKAYVWVTGGSEGIVLYLRQLYVLWVGIVTGLVFFGLKGLVLAVRGGDLRRVHHLRRARRLAAQLGHALDRLPHHRCGSRRARRARRRRRGGGAA